MPMSGGRIVHNLVKREPRSPPPFIKSEPIEGGVSVSGLFKPNTLLRRYSSYCQPPTTPRKGSVCTTASAVLKSSNGRDLDAKGQG